MEKQVKENEGKSRFLGDTVQFFKYSPSVKLLKKQPFLEEK